MSIQAPFYPIIFIRGYAMGRGDIESAVDVPYMGFSEGSTKLRDVEDDGEPIQFFFESPLVRLLKEWGYTDCYRENRFAVSEDEIPPKSIWVFRYYDLASKTFGDGGRREIVDYAVELRKFVLQVRDTICGDNANMRAQFKAHLVCHSQGGLIARSYLQRICTKGLAGIASEETALALELSNDGGDPMVEKLFTYGTPHNGIELAGIRVPDLGSLSVLETRAFNRDKIREACALEPASPGEVKPPANQWSGSVPLKNVFCLIGSDWERYNIAASRALTRESSDGLVMMKNASVKGASRAVVHRAHGGPYGIVNSETGFQNLTRFLFGGIRVDAHLRIDEVSLPRVVQKKADKGKKIKANYFVDTRVAIRGSVVALHERRREDASAIILKYEDVYENPISVYLASQYLHTDSKHRPTSEVAFSVSIRIDTPIYKVKGKLFTNEHFEDQSLLNETVRLYWKPSGVPRLRYGLDSFTSGDFKRTANLAQRSEGVFVAEIPLGVKSDPLPPGSIKASLILTAQPVDQ